MRSLKNKKILITCGPTCIAIDNMRVLTNRSTGELGQRLALQLLKKGAQITVLEGPVLKPLQSNALKVYRYFLFDELEKLLNQELKKKYDIVIHAAAVSDYKLNAPFQAKLSSNLKTLTLKLVPTKKLINTIKKKASRTFLVGFKLVDHIQKTIGSNKLHKFLKENKSDLVIVNSLTNGKYEAVIIDNQQHILAKANSRQDVVNKLIKLL